MEGNNTRVGDSIVVANNRGDPTHDGATARNTRTLEARIAQFEAGNQPFISLNIDGQEVPPSTLKAHLIRLYRQRGVPNYDEQAGKNDLDAIRKALDSHEARFKASASQVENQIDALSRTNRILQQEVNDAKSTAIQLGVDQETTKVRDQELIDKVSTLCAQNQLLVDKVGTLEGEVASLKGDKDALKEATNAVAGGLDQLRATNNVAALTSEVAQIKADKQASGQKLEVLEKNYRRLQTENAAFKNMTSSLATRVAKLEKATTAHHQYHKNHTKSGVQENGGRVTVHVNHYVPWLQALDFRPPDGIVRLDNADLQVSEHPLCTIGDNSHFLRRGGSYVNEAVCLDRNARGHVDDDRYSTKKLPWTLREYQNRIVELELKRPPRELLLCPPPKYVLPLGEIYVATRNEKFDDDICNSGYQLVMDVTKPSKPLWVVYMSEVMDKDGTPRTRNLWCRGGFLPKCDFYFDLAKIAAGVTDWNRTTATKWVDQPELHADKMEECLLGSARYVQPVFTVPNLNSLLKAIEEGWEGYGESG